MYCLRTSSGVGALELEEHAANDFVLSGLVETLDAHALSISVAGIIIVAGDFQPRAAHSENCNASRPLLGQDDIRIGVVVCLPGPKTCISIITIYGMIMILQLTLHTCLSACTVTLWWSDRSSRAHGAPEPNLALARDAKDP